MSSAKHLSTHCILLPKSEEHTIEDGGGLFKKDNCVCSTSVPPVEMSFDAVHDSVSDIKTAVYDPVISPLIHRATQGDSTLCILGGDRDESYLTSLLHTTITELLQLATHNDTTHNHTTHGIVKLTWFTVGADGFEPIVDVLKAPQRPIPASGIPLKPVDLVLRDLTSGRGMIVPGLVEVEITGPEDIQAVLEHVHTTAVSALTDATTHSVVQVTFTDLRRVSRAAKQKNFVALGALKDPPGAGRVTIIQLSNLRAEEAHRTTTSPTTRGSPSPQKTTRNGVQNKPNSATRGRFTTILPTEPVVIEPVTESGAYYPWIENTKLVMQWMENKRASTPFHKSRLLLLMKDMLLRRQSAALLLILEQSSHAANLDWLRVVWLMSRNYAPPPAIISHRGAVSQSKQNVAKRVQMQPIDVSLEYNQHHQYNYNEYSFQTTAESAVDTVHSGSSGTSGGSGGNNSYNNNNSTNGINNGGNNGSSGAYSDSGTYHAPSPRSGTHSRSLSRVNSMDNSTTSVGKSMTPRTHPHTPRTQKSNTSTNSNTNTNNNTNTNSANRGFGDSKERGLLGRAASTNALLGVHNSLKHSLYTQPYANSPLTPESAGMKKRFFRSTLERIEGEIFEGYKQSSGGTGGTEVGGDGSVRDGSGDGEEKGGDVSVSVEEEEIKPYVPAVTPRRSKPSTPKHRTMKHLTAREVAAAMRALSLRNKKAAQAAAVAKETMLVPPLPEPESESTPIEQNNATSTENTQDTVYYGASGSTGSNTNNNPDYSTSGTSEAEVEDLRKRLQEAQGRCTVLETEKGLPLSYPSPEFDENLFYTKWGPIGKSKRRSSVQMFIQAHGAAVEFPGQNQGLLTGLGSRSVDRYSVSSGESNDGQSDVRGVEVGGGVGGGSGGSGGSGEGSVGGSASSDGVRSSVGGASVPTGPGKSLYEQLMETIASLRALEAKYKELDGKYNTLLAASQRISTTPVPVAAASGVIGPAAVDTSRPFKEPAGAPAEAVSTTPAVEKHRGVEVNSVDGSSHPTPSPATSLPVRSPSVVADTTTDTTKAPAPVHRSASLTRTASAPAGSGWNSSTRMNTTPARKVSVSIVYPVPVPGAPPIPVMASKSVPGSSPLVVTPRKASYHASTKSVTPSHAVTHTPGSVVRTSSHRELKPAISSVGATSATTLLPSSVPAPAPATRPNAMMSLFAQMDDADEAPPTRRRERSVSSDAPSTTGDKGTDEKDADSSFESVENVDENVDVAVYVPVSEPLLEHDSIYHTETDVVTYNGVNMMSHKEKTSYVPFASPAAPTPAQASPAMRPTPSPSQQGKFSLHNVRPDLLFKAGSRGSVRGAASLLSPARPGSVKVSPLAEKLGKGLFSTPLTTPSKVEESFEVSAEVKEESTQPAPVEEEAQVKLDLSAEAGEDTRALVQDEEEGHRILSNSSLPDELVEESPAPLSFADVPVRVFVESTEPDAGASDEQQQATLHARPQQAALLSSEEDPDVVVAAIPNCEGPPPLPSTTGLDTSAPTSAPSNAAKKTPPPQQFRLPPMMGRPALRSTGKVTTDESHIAPVESTESGDAPLAPLPPSPPTKSAPNPPSRRFSSVLAGRRRPSRVKPFTSAPAAVGIATESGEKTEQLVPPVPPPPAPMVSTPAPPSDEMFVSSPRDDSEDSVESAPHAKLNVTEIAEVGRVVVISQEGTELSDVVTSSAEEEQSSDVAEVEEAELSLAAETLEPAMVQMAAEDSEWVGGESEALSEDGGYASEDDLVSETNPSDGIVPPPPPTHTVLSVLPPPPPLPVSPPAEESYVDNTNGANEDPSAEEVEGGDVNYYLEHEQGESLSDRESPIPVRTHRVSFSYVPQEDDLSVASSTVEDVELSGAEQEEEDFGLSEVESDTELPPAEALPVLLPHSSLSLSDEATMLTEITATTEATGAEAEEKDHNAVHEDNTDTLAEMTETALAPSIDLTPAADEEHNEPAVDELPPQGVVSSDDESVEPVRTHRVSFDYVPESEDVDAASDTDGDVEKCDQGDEEEEESTDGPALSVTLDSDVFTHDVDVKAEDVHAPVDSPVEAAVEEESVEAVEESLGQVEEEASSDEEPEPVRTHRPSFSSAPMYHDASEEERSDSGEVDNSSADGDESEAESGVESGVETEDENQAEAGEEDFSYDLYGAEEPEEQVFAEKGFAQDVPQRHRPHRSGGYAQLAHSAHPSHSEDAEDECDREEKSANLPSASSSQAVSPVVTQPSGPALIPPPPPPPPPAATIVVHNEERELERESSDEEEDAAREPEPEYVDDQEEVRPSHRRSVSFSSTDQLHILHTASSDAEEYTTSDAVEIGDVDGAEEREEQEVVPSEDSSVASDIADETDPAPVESIMSAPPLHPAPVHHEGRYAQLARSTLPHSSSNEALDSRAPAHTASEPVSVAAVPPPPPPPPVTESRRVSFGSSHPRVFVSASGSDTDEDSPVPDTEGADMSMHSEHVDSSDEEDSHNSNPQSAGVVDLSHELEQLDIAASDSDTEDEGEDEKPVPVPVPSGGKRVSYAEPESLPQPLHEGMYAQLAHSAHPNRFDRQQTFSAHDLERREELFSPSMESSAENSPSHSPGPPFGAKNMPYSFDRSSSVASVGSDLEPVPDRYSLAEGLDMSRISEVVRPPHAGMYAQMAQAISPVRPMSVPNPSSALEEDEEESPAADRKKKTKSSRWSWLRGKH